MSENPMPCQRCGLPHTKCIAHTRAGKPCGQKPMQDQAVCRMHGGSAPQSLAAAEARRAERDVLVSLETFGVPVATDPHTALLEELYRSNGVVLWLGAVVAELDVKDVTWGESRVKVGGEDHGTTSEAGVNLWVKLWTEQRKHLVDVAAACARAGIEERRVRLAEEQGRLLAGVITRILSGMFDALVGALSEHEAARVLVEAAWPRLVGEIVPHELRAVAVGQVTAS
jgi:hypothetical protein